MQNSARKVVIRVPLEKSNTLQQVLEVSFVGKAIFIFKNLEECKEHRLQLLRKKLLQGRNKVYPIPINGFVLLIHFPRKDLSKNHIFKNSGHWSDKENNDDCWKHFPSLTLRT